MDQSEVSEHRGSFPRQLPLRVRVLIATLLSAFLVVAASEAYRLWSVRDERLAL